MAKRARNKAAPVTSAAPVTKDFSKQLIQNARLMPDRRTFDRQQADRRQSERAIIDTVASMGVSLDDGQQGRLYNLSAEGCSLCLSPGLFGVGDEVWLKIEATRPLRGTVRWTEDDKVGVEFERPFYRSIFELIVQSNRPLAISKAA